MDEVISRQPHIAETGFDPRPVCMWFIAEKMALGQVLWILRFSCVIVILPVRDTQFYFIYQWCYIILAVYSVTSNTFLFLYSVKLVSLYLYQMTPAE